MVPHPPPPLIQALVEFSLGITEFSFAVGCHYVIIYNLCYIYLIIEVYDTALLYGMRGPIRLLLRHFVLVSFYWQ